MVTSTHIVPLLIDEREVLSDPEFIFEVSSPYDVKQVLYKAQGATVTLVNEACKSSYSAFQKWKFYSPEEKRKVFDTVVAKLENKRKDFIENMKAMGVSEQFGEINLQTTIDILKDCGRYFHEPVGEVLPRAHRSALILKEPIGPVLSIVPWNSPMILCARAIVAPLAAGCSVILKTSEQSPLIHQELARLFVDSGAPPGLVNTIHHSAKQASEITTALIAAQEIRKINFTGSTGVGSIIAQTAAKFLKPVLLELGGKCSAVVTETANIDSAADSILTGAWLHNGQICMSTERAFVVDSVYEEFMAALEASADKIASNIKGHPQRSLAQAVRVENLVSDAVTRGAKLAYGKPNRRECFLDPVVLTDVTLEHDLYHTETFGPVLYVVRVENQYEAIERINASSYGLSCSVWSENMSQAVDIAERLESGAVHINGMTVHDEPTIPHGGCKASGYGRFNGKYGISEFQTIKCVTFNR